MSYTVFSKKNNDQTKENMFFGQSVNIARYDQQKFEVFEKLIEKQLSFFWRPEEIDITKDKRDFAGLPEHQKHIFISNLKYQTLLDSIQGRSPNLALLPIVSIPELETWIETWSFSETIHSRSYTHILRNIFTEPGEVFEDIVENEEIQKRAGSVAYYMDRLINYTREYQVGVKGTTQRECKKRLFLCLMAQNILEAVRFYVSFACSFAFAEQNLMEGNAKIIKLIARDEALHLTGTVSIIQIWKNYQDDPEMGDIAKECEEESIAMFHDAAKQEKEWAAYLFKDGSMIGLNENIINKYVEYITNQRMTALDYPKAFPDAIHNPIPWVNHWFSNDNVQVAPQEAEITSYLSGAVDSNIDDSDFDDFSL